MKHAEAHDRLHDCADGQLSEAERAALESHLAACVACREDLDELLELIAESSALPAAIDPPGDLWAGIAKAIAADARPERRGATSRIWRWTRPTAALAWSGALAAAALLLLMLFGERGGQTPFPDELAERGVLIGSPSFIDRTPDATIAALEAEYRPTRAQETALAYATEDQASRKTMEHIQANLRLIDLAIAQAQEAWLSDPHNSLLASRVAAAYRAKARLQADQMRVVKIL